MNELTQAIENDSIAKLKSLLQAGTDLNKPILIGEEYDLEEYDEISPLFYAIRKYASLEMIELMLENGVDLYATDSDGISALDMAIKFKRKEIIRYCIDKGMELNSTKRKSGILPVMLAACFSDTELVQMLLDHGADINATDASGMSAKDYAKKLGQKKMVAYLSEKGARHNLYPEEA
ncbi:ankyrin repeat domain-containing protein [Sulfurovum sp.]|uniref:ankyrin repeat domain-containing protein n=1 Tax=Sulfurovum sp. TaxID=1969726 RepID=UPI0025D769BB|nr:ankyrin repeat domain-containing protein [Sulfurovum sp.]